MSMTGGSYFFLYNCTVDMLITGLLLHVTIIVCTMQLTKLPTNISSLTHFWNPVNNLCVSHVNINYWYL